MATDINQWTKECIPCQKAKIHHHVSPPPPPSHPNPRKTFFPCPCRHCWPPSHLSGMFTHPHNDRQNHPLA
jgi:hypothetical protein